MFSSIKLLQHEEQICSVLTSTAKGLLHSHPSLPPVSLRIAGGWVRDKLLGLTSDDIDIAIDTMEGLPFANHVHAYMDKHEMHMSSISTIQSNPDKSKHLETATARVLGHDIDFVNLRTETYNELSRNPQVVCLTNIRVWNTTARCHEA
jgi:tRNA nucleotidyltransferase (CCA-adding enzyme)